jgi:hypothetical protein
VQAALGKKLLAVGSHNPYKYAAELQHTASFAGDGYINSWIASVRLAR